ncbi:MAG TPA: TAXI family TRAP transporter solute-binding subunit [Nevskiaceae bacterium]|nr:TAXI family TRAP transporter solute-binding subunit [Nevskiaceae bacterium]
MEKNRDADTDAAQGAPRRRRVRLPLPQIPRISWRDLVATLGPVLLLAAAAVFAALHFVRPAPPRTLTISSGPPGSSYASMAEQYRDILADSGITLKIVASEGSLANLHSLIDEDSDVDVAFVPSGISAGEDISELVSLGSVFYQPLTIFYRREQPLERLSQLAGGRIAIGAVGSGTRIIALDLLKANGIEPGGTTQLEPIEGGAAIDALMARKVDAIFLSGDSASRQNIRQLLHEKGVRLFDFPQAEAYARRFRYLTRLEIPAGAFDLGENLPAKNISMLAPTVELVARWDLHPALSDLLIETARQVNGKASVLQEAGEFPAPRPHDFPLSDDAQRYYKSGKGYAYRFLPFWLASLVDRAVVVLVPLIVVLLPGLRVVPALYAWRVKNRIYKHYGALMAVERAALAPMTPEQREDLRARLAEIEKAVIEVKMPGAYANQLYVLREHIKFVQDQLVSGR